MVNGQKTAILENVEKTKTEVAKSKYDVITKQCRAAISACYCDKENEIVNSGNVGNFYKYINSRLSCKGRIPSLQKPDGSMAVSDSEKAEVLQQQFKNVFTMDNGVSHVLNNVNPDMMSPRMLFKLRNILCVPLALVFGALFREGVLPELWLTSFVTPIFKKGTVSDPMNYRPISLTCIACRVMEKVIKAIIVKYLLDNKLINKAQHGFLCRRSTVTQLLECTNDWTL